MPTQPVTIDESRLEQLLDDGNWCLQQKYDGIRCIVTCKDGRLEATNRMGDPLKGRIRRPVEPDCPRIPHRSSNSDYILDGELAWGNYYPFDELTRPDRPYLARLTSAVQLVSEWNRPHIRRVKTWRKPDAKRKAYTKAREVGVEGVILRRLTAKHVDGEDPTACVRFKFIKRIEVILTEQVGRKRSFRMELIDVDGQPTTCGNVSTPRQLDFREVYTNLNSADSTDLRRPSLCPGRLPVVAEVEYLYATPNGRLTQPKFIRLRPDKPADACTVTQLEYTHAGELDQPSTTRKPQLPARQQSPASRRQSTIPRVTQARARSPSHAHPHSAIDTEGPDTDWTKILMAILWGISS